jgi:uridine phosphorylase
LRAWYLKLSAEDATEDVVLVGDRSRALRSADLLDGAVVANEDRGLTTVIGGWKGLPVTVSAFGMGGPIAAIVLHELAALGSRRFLRAGTMMVRGIPTGTFIVVESALVHEGTSSAYGVDGPLVDLDRRIVDAALSVAPASLTRSGTVASCDGFYTQMTDLLGTRVKAVDLDALWDRHQVIGIDMETSALANVARTLGVEFGSVCLGTVDSDGPTLMEQENRDEMEQTLLEIAFDTLFTLKEGSSP